MRNVLKTRLPKRLEWALAILVVLIFLVSGVYGYMGMPTAAEVAARELAAELRNARWTAIDSSRRIAVLFVSSPDSGGGSYRSAEVDKDGGFVGWVGEDWGKCPVQVSFSGASSISGAKLSEAGISTTEVPAVVFAPNGSSISVEFEFSGGVVNVDERFGRVDVSF